MRLSFMWLPFALSEIENRCFIERILFKSLAFSLNLKFYMKDTDILKNKPVQIIELGNLRT